MSSNNSNEIAKELIGKIQQFLNHQVESNEQLSDTAKESLTVAMECIEQAYSLERKSASRELLDIYRTHKQGSSSSATSASSATAGQNPGGLPNASPFGANPEQLLQNLTSTLLSNLVGGVTNPQQQQTTQAPTQTQASETASNSNVESQSVEPKKTRRSATDAERIAAESFKNQGNDLMKEEKYKEAYKCYSRAIEIDNNNAIYYSNRAAASAKLGDHEAAVRDCQEAIEIDPKYSKAYGRMGLAYASLDKHLEAKNAYIKAVEFDPNNESYRNNLNFAEEKLAESSNSREVPNPGANMANILRSVMGNQEVMSMAMRSLQDPRMQSVFGNLLGGVVGNLHAPGGAGASNTNSRPQDGANNGQHNS